MLKAKLDNKIYELPLGDIYRDKFKEYIRDDVLDLSLVSSDKLYQVIDLLFGYVANSLTLFGIEYYPSDLIDEKKDILTRMSSVDRLQKYMAKEGKVDRSIEMIKNFLVVMLEHHEKLMNHDKGKVI